MNYGNPAMDKVLEEAQVSMNVRRRRERYARAARLMLDDMPGLSLYQQVDRCGVRRRLRWEARSDERTEMCTVTIISGSEERR